MSMLNAEAIEGWEDKVEAEGRYQRTAEPSNQNKSTSPGEAHRKRFVANS
jgi:hypothetical protein